jgi:hypothetical protein
MDDILSWAIGMNFDNIHFNLMHDPWEYAIANMPKSAVAPVMLYLQKCQVKYQQFASDIDALKKIVINSQQKDADGLHTKIRRTDLYRAENFAVTHSKIAKAIGYEL